MSETPKQTSAPSETPKQTSAPSETTPIPSTVEEEVLDQFKELTVHGNKSQKELRDIQSKLSHLSAGILFSDPRLMIPAPILESLTQEMRFEKPSQVQASTLPLILAGHNVIAQAQSGAGKTIAFTIGMLAKVDTSIPQVQALCLAPTRELANQILTDAVRPLSTRMPGLTSEAALPGRDPVKGSTCPSHIVVGTPGTVKKWILTKYIPAASIRIFVLDEADKMVEEKALGTDTMSIRKTLSDKTQILLFSATYEAEILAYAKRITPRAYVVTPRSQEELVLDVIFQVRVDVSKRKDTNVEGSDGGPKLAVLKDIYDFMAVQQSIVFVETRRSADAVARMMRAAEFEVSVLHSELQPEDRDRVMDDFRAGRSKVLITTNVLARGVDVPAVAVVVNYDLPVARQGQKIVPDPATYLHRIGRCGRFGRRGTAINFLNGPADDESLLAIENYFSPSARFTNEWDANDISGLSDAITARPDGGEILPTAVEGNDGAAAIKVTTLE